jgi:S1-C subfamily serine protease
MSTEGDGDDDADDRIPPLHPDDRLWRHPSEVSAFGLGRASPVVATVPPAGSRASVWPVALVAGLVGAVLCTGVLAVTGNLAFDREQPVERVKVSAIVPPPSLGDAETIDAVADRVSRSVVRLQVFSDRGESAACGVVVRDDGIVMTSAHEVSDASTITVLLADGREVQGELVGADLPSDVAVVRIGARALTPAVLGSSEDLEAGAATMAVGTTRGGDRAVSTGVISLLRTRLDVGGESLHGVIQTDAPVEPTWSGGPLVDATGAVIGITTDLASDQTPFGFAIPIDLARRLADQLLAHGKVAHAWLGIQGADLSDGMSEVLGISGGAEVRRVMAGSPAARAGLVSGDVITELGAEPIRSSTDLVVALRLRSPGDVVVIGYWRGGRHHQTEVTIDHAP